MREGKPIIRREDLMPLSDPEMEEGVVGGVVARMRRSR